MQNLPQLTPSVRVVQTIPKYCSLRYFRHRSSSALNLSADLSRHCASSSVSDYVCSDSAASSDSSICNSAYSSAQCACCGGNSNLPPTNLREPFAKRPFAHRHLHTDVHDCSYRRPPQSLNRTPIRIGELVRIVERIRIAIEEPHVAFAVGGNRINAQHRADAGIVIALLLTRIPSPHVWGIGRHRSVSFHAGDYGNPDLSLTRRHN